MPTLCPAHRRPGRPVAASSPAARARLPPRVLVPNGGSPTGVRGCLPSGRRRTCCSMAFPRGAAAPLDGACPGAGAHRRRRLPSPQRGWAAQARRRPSATCAARAGPGSGSGAGASLPAAELQSPSVSGAAGIGRATAGRRPAARPGWLAAPGAEPGTGARGVGDGVGAPARGRAGSRRRHGGAALRATALPALQGTAPAQRPRAAGGAGAPPAGPVPGLRRDRRGAPPRLGGRGRPGPGESPRRGPTASRTPCPRARPAAGAAGWAGGRPPSAGAQAAGAAGGRAGRPGAGGGGERQRHRGHGRGARRPWRPRAARETRSRRGGARRGEHPCKSHTPHAHQSFSGSCAVLSSPKTWRFHTGWRFVRPGRNKLLVLHF